MQEVAKFTKLDANQRNNEIMTALKSISSKFNSPSMEIINDQKVMGIKLNPPRINLGKNKDLSNDTGFFIIKDPVYMGAHIKDWFMIYSGRSKNDDKDADFLVNELKKNGSKIGIRVEDPYYIVVKDNNPNTWVRELE